MKSWRTMFARLMLGTIVGVVSAGTAHAGPIWEFTSLGDSNTFTDGSWDFATAFTPSTNLTVTGLGYYADPETGLVDSNPVALYKCDNSDCSSTATLLASVIVDNSNPLIGHFHYVDISPIILTAGTAYEVAGVSYSDSYTWSDPGFATDPAVTLISLGGQAGRWQFGTTPDFLNFGQNDLGGLDGYWGPNVFLGGASTLADPVPEPASLSLLGLGLAFAARVTRRRKKQ